MMTQITDNIKILISPFIQMSIKDVGDDSNIDDVVKDVVDDFKNFITEVEHQTIIAIEKGIENEK